MSETALTIASTIAGDGAKFLEAIPALTTAYTAVQGTLTADQHASLVQKVTDLAAAVTPSVDSAAAAGLIGNTDAANAGTIASAITTGAAEASLWAQIFTSIKSWF